jgi:hypothetical protein
LGLANRPYRRWFANIFFFTRNFNYILKPELSNISGDNNMMSFTAYLRKLWKLTPKGTATVANGTTNIDVTHGYGATPDVSQLHITATNNLGSATKWWVSNIGGTTFRINVNADPGATTATFSWRII